MSKVRSALESPWRLLNEARRLLFHPFFYIVSRAFGLELQWNTRLYGLPRIQRYFGSKIVLGENATLRSWASSNPLTPHNPVLLSTRTSEAEILIGPRCGMTGAVIVSEERITIGADVYIGANVIITDTDFHPLHPIERNQDPSGGRHSPVSIGDSVFIGMQSLILKGVSIGNGAVIGAGSVVTRDIPAMSIAAGNPAVVLRKIEQ